MHLHSWAMQIHDFCRKNNVNFHTAWVPRELNSIADEWSKFEDPDGWSVSLSLFEKAQCLMGENFTVDLFASDQNNKCEKFFSRFACIGSAGVDAFDFSWFGEVCWITPPPKLALKALNHLRDSYSKGVLLIPSWKSLSVWPVIEDVDFRPFIKGSWEFPGKLFLENSRENSIMGPRFRGAIRLIALDFTM